jgi:hypothetical protein
MKNVDFRKTCNVKRVVGVIALTVGITTDQAFSGYTVADFPVSPFTGGIAGFGSGSYMPAQTFTALGSGELQGISLALAQNGPVLPNHIVVEFRNTVSDIPSPSILASATIDGNLLAGVQPGSPVMLTADFSSYHINLSSSSTYAFSLRTDDAGFAEACGSGAYVVYNYAGGSLFDSFNSGTSWNPQSLYDINFQITVVPEPSAFGLVGLGVLVTCFGQRVWPRAMRERFLTKRCSERSGLVTSSACAALAPFPTRR